MDKQFPTFEQALSYTREVNKKLLPYPPKSYEFKKIITKVSDENGRITPEDVDANINVLFKNEPDLVDGFQKFLPINLQHPLQVVAKDQETHSTKSKVKYNDIKKILEFVNRVQKGMQDDPDLLSKFCELMGEYRNDLDQEKLKKRLSIVFNPYPEFEFEFQHVTTEWFPKSHKNDHFKLREIREDSLEGILLCLEDEMIRNDIVMSRISSAIDNIARLGDESGKKRKGIEVATYLTSNNIKDIEEYCEVDVEMLSSNLQECKYVVLRKLRHKLKLMQKKNFDVIRKKKVHERNGV